MFDFERHVVKIPLQVHDVSLEEWNKFHGQSQNFSTLFYYKGTYPMNPRTVYIVESELEKRKKASCFYHKHNNNIFTFQQMTVYIYIFVFSIF